MSDYMEEQYSCCCLVNEKTKPKVLCGDPVGKVAIFHWGHFGYKNGAITVSRQFNRANKAGVTSILKLEDDTVLVGGEDGKVRAVKCYSDKKNNTNTYKANYTAMVGVVSE